MNDSRQREIFGEAGKNFCGGSFFEKCRSETIVEQSGTSQVRFAHPRAPYKKLSFAKGHRLTADALLTLLTFNFIGYKTGLLHFSNSPDLLSDDY